MERNFTKQESLDLINEMIAQAQGNLQKGSGNSMIFIGYFVAFVALLNFLLLYFITPSYNSFWVWLLMIPMSICNFILKNRIDKMSIVKTHVDRIIDSVWRMFFIAVVFLLVVVFGFVYIFQNWMITILITPSILIMTGGALYVTGIAIKFDEYKKLAFLFLCGALLCVISYLISYPNFQFVILAFCMIVGFVVPGHILNRKVIKDV